MRLTSSRGGADKAALSRSWADGWSFPALLVGFLAIFVLDRATGSAPVQHLYYLPIMLAAYRFGRSGGWLSALIAVVLYHFANGSVFSVRFREADVIQVALFLAVGVVTAKLVGDAKRLHELAMTDDLTGLHNLRSFEERFIGMVRASRQANDSLSLLVLDVDHLKSLNDQHGHLAGAEAVRAVGHLLAEHLPQVAVACRYGGDEFAVALPCCPAERAQQIGDLLCKAVNASAPRLLGRGWPAGTLSISVGAACRSFHSSHFAGSLHTDEQAGENMFRAADAALYQAKISGRNRVYRTQADAS